MFDPRKFCRIRVKPELLREIAPALPAMAEPVATAKAIGQEIIPSRESRTDCP
jgi:hypothetical protein